MRGDRAYAVVDRDDGRVATGKHPRTWSKLVELAAAYVDGPDSPVAITFPDGTVVRSDEPGIDGLAPTDVVEAMSGGRREGTDPVSDIPSTSTCAATARTSSSTRATTASSRTTGRARRSRSARHNRVEITAMGTWACAGVYASVTTPGTVSRGDAVRIA